MEELEKFDKRLENLATQLSSLACDLSKASKPHPRLPGPKTDSKQAPERKRQAENAAYKQNNNSNSSNNKTCQFLGSDHENNKFSTTTPPPTKRARQDGDQTPNAQDPKA